MIETRKTSAIVLASVACIIQILNIILPIFSFWNYRLYMAMLLPVSVVVLFATIKQRKSKVDILLGCLVAIWSVGVTIFSGVLDSVVVCAVVSCLIGIVLIMRGKPKFFASKGTLAKLVIVISAIVLFVQCRTIASYYESSRGIRIDPYIPPEVRNNVADNLLVASFNEVGMLITICCFLLLFLAICIKSRPCEPVPKEMQRPLVRPAGPWTCECGHANTENDRFCKGCGQYR